MAAMKTIPMNLTIDRNNNSGSAAISGNVNGQKVHVRVERGVTDGTAYANGVVGSDDVRLSMGRSLENGYENAIGYYGKTQLSAAIRRYQPDGDTTVAQNGQQLLIDRQNQGQHVQLGSGPVSGSFERDLRDGDEYGHIGQGRGGFDYSLDRDPRTGNFTLKGRTDEGPFQLEARRSLDGDLSLNGTVPEGLKMFPLLWEVLGDDKHVPDRNPEYPGSVMAMSVFLQD